MIHRTPHLHVNVTALMNTEFLNKPLGPCMLKVKLWCKPAEELFLTFTWVSLKTSSGTLHAMSALGCSSTWTSAVAAPFRWSDSCMTEVNKNGRASTRWSRFKVGWEEGLSERRLCSRRSGLYRTVRGHNTAARARFHYWGT